MHGRLCARQERFRGMFSCDVRGVTMKIVTATTALFIVGASALWAQSTTLEEGKPSRYFDSGVAVLDCHDIFRYSVVLYGDNDHPLGGQVPDSATKSIIGGSIAGKFSDMAPEPLGVFAGKATAHGYLCAGLGVADNRRPPGAWGWYGAGALEARRKDLPIKGHGIAPPLAKVLSKLKPHNRWLRRIICFKRLMIFWPKAAVII